jgi:tetratricopeptide (TPR) repeat protein
MSIFQKLNGESYKNTLVLGFSLVFVFLFFYLNTNSIAREKYQNKGLKSLFFTLMDSSEASAKNDLKKSLVFADQAKAYADSLNNEQLQVIALNQIGKLNFIVGLLDFSSEAFLKSLAILRKSSNPDIKQKLDATIGLGANYLSSSEYKKAEEMFEAALELVEKLPEMDYLSYSTIYNNLGIIYREQGNLVQAYSILEKAMKMLEEHDPDNPNLTLLYGNFGMVHEKMNNYEMAGHFIDKSYAISKKRNDKIGVLTSLIHFGMLFRKKNEPDNAIAIFRQSLSLSKEIESLYYQQISSSNLMDLYRIKGNTDSTLFFLDTKNNLDHIINLNEAKNKLMAEEIRMMHEKEREKMMEATLTKEKKFYVVLLTVALFSSFLIFLLYKMKKQNTKLELELLNNKLGIERDELDRNLIQSKLEEKEKQLTLNLIYSLKRNEILKEATNKLIEHRKYFNKEGQEVVRGVLQDLNSIKEEQIFKEFEASFLNLHVGFFDNLAKDYPDLTLNEKRICAFVRLNLTSKEIMGITGQTQATLNMAKTRLRKKMGITNETVDLHNFLAKY